MIFTANPPFNPMLMACLHNGRAKNKKIKINASKIKSGISEMLYSLYNRTFRGAITIRRRRIYQ